MLRTTSSGSKFQRRENKKVKLHGFSMQNVIIPIDVTSSAVLKWSIETSLDFFRIVLHISRTVLCVISY